MASTPPLPARRRGVLAFLPDTLHHYPYDEQAWKLAERKRPRRAPVSAVEQAPRQEEEEEEEEENVNTSDYLASASAVAILLLDPVQPSSRRWLHLLQQRLRQEQQKSQSEHPIRLIVVIVASSTGQSPLLQHSGCFVARTNNMLQTACGFQACPALAVVEPKQGRKVSSATEEWALEWNLPSDTLVDPVIKAWKEGRSALTWKQQALATVLSPASCTTM